MADYSNEKTSAYNDIKAAGCSISVTTTTHGTYNGATETYSSTTSTVQPTYAVITSYKEFFIDGNRIKAGDKLFLIPALLPSGSDLSIDENSTITVGSTTYNIMNLDSISPSNDAIMYKVHVRK